MGDSPIDTKGDAEQCDVFGADVDEHDRTTGDACEWSPEWRGTSENRPRPRGRSARSADALLPSSTITSWTVSLDGDPWSGTGTIAVGSTDGSGGEADDGGADGDGSPGFGAFPAGLGLLGARAIGRRLGWWPRDGPDS